MTTALLADDEPLLLDALRRELSMAWSELEITAMVNDGASAIDRLLNVHHDIAFLDIRMPNASGIEVMQAIAEEWPENVEQTIVPPRKGKPITANSVGNEERLPPAFVIVSAYEEFALQAFEQSAIDYILKPVTAARLSKTVKRLQSNQMNRSVDQLTQQLINLFNTHNTGLRSPAPLRTIRASVGTTVKLIPINDVILFQASDKYVVVHTATMQALIRESLRDLLPQVDPERFKQIHRGSIVNMDYVDAAIRLEKGKMALKLRSIDHEPVVSRVYRHLFQPM